MPVWTLGQDNNRTPAERALATFYSVPASEPKVARPVLKLDRFREDPVNEGGEICKPLCCLISGNTGWIKRLNHATFAQDEVALASVVHDLDHASIETGALNAKAPRLGYTRHVNGLVTSNDHVERIDQEIADVLCEIPKIANQRTSEADLQVMDCR